MEDTIRPGVALALSGGGFRATLFHLGTLIRLNELGYLPNLDRISSVSGGSITAGMLASAWTQLKEEDFKHVALESLVIAPLRAFCSRNIDTLAIAEGTISPWASRNDVLTREYDVLYHGSSLAALPDRPRFVFNATNLQTGRNVRMSKPYLVDYRIGQIVNPDLKVAVAVSASSAFPPVLSPCVVDVDPDKWQRLTGADLFDDPRFKHTLSLTDGGIYDNLGLQTVDTFKTVLVSDAGAPFGLHDRAKDDPIGQMSRALDIATDQMRGLRKANLIRLGALRQQKIAYWGIDTDYSEYPASGTLSCDPKKTVGLKDVRTRLNAFSPAEQDNLINWGYALCDAAVRSYLESDSTSKPTWPCTNNPLG